MNDENASTILVIGKNERNAELLKDFLSRLGYRTVAVSSYDELDDTLANFEYQLALADISGFDHAIWDRCEKIRSCGAHLLIISPKQSIALSNESIKHGASGLLIKPLVMKELAALIKGLLKG